MMTTFQNDTAKTSKSFCGDCGASMKQEQQFCHDCGAKNVWGNDYAESTSASTATEEVPQSESQPEQLYDSRQSASTDIEASCLEHRIQKDVVTDHAAEAFCLEHRIQKDVVTDHAVSSVEQLPQNPQETIPSVHTSSKHPNHTNAYNYQGESRQQQQAESFWAFAGQMFAVVLLAIPISIIKYLMYVVAIAVIVAIVFAVFGGEIAGITYWGFMYLAFNIAVILTFIYKAVLGPILTMFNNHSLKSSLSEGAPSAYELDYAKRFFNAEATAKIVGSLVSAAVAFIFWLSMPQVIGLFWTDVIALGIMIFGGGIFGMPVHAPLIHLLYKKDPDMFNAIHEADKKMKGW